MASLDDESIFTILPLAENMFSGILCLAMMPKLVT